MEGRPIWGGPPCSSLCSQVAEDIGNTPHGLLRLRIAIDMLCNEIAVMLSPFFDFLRLL